ncbi:MAG: hypothetical protein ACLU4J_19525 [Butyricimonas paravirosa]
MKDIVSRTRVEGADNAQPKDLKPAEGHYLPWSKCIMNYNNSVKYNTVFGMSLRLSEAYLILAEACIIQMKNWL